jgi:hypothetical protein
MTRILVLVVALDLQRMVATTIEAGLETAQTTTARPKVAGGLRNDRNIGGEEASPDGPLVSHQQSNEFKLVLLPSTQTKNKAEATSDESL